MIYFYMANCSNTAHLNTLMMKKFNLAAGFIFLFSNVQSQNIGMGTNTPEQKLDVNGAIKIGTTSQNVAGSIRYNAGSFEGGNGSSWQSLEGLPSKAIIMAQEPDTGILKTKGFSVLRSMDIWDTSYINIPHNFPGAWSNGFPVSAGTVPTTGTSSRESVYYNGRFIVYGSNGFLYSYNTGTQVWEQLPNASPLGDRISYGISLVGNDIYVTGGWRFVNPNFVFYNTAAKYSMTTNTWTSIANMPVGNAYHATAVVGTDLYILNGASSFNGSDFVFSTKLYRYNTVSNSWSADLATGSTPSYLLQGGTTGRNGKFLYGVFSMRTNGGNNYILLVEYDPVTHSNTTISSGPPFPYTIQPSFREMSFLATTADKVLVAAYLPDSTQVGYNWANPTATPESMMVLYEVTVSTGLANQLNSCTMAGSIIALWQYSSVTGSVYAKNATGNFVLFNPSGSGSCNTVIRRRGYWSYMKKN